MAATPMTIDEKYTRVTQILYPFSGLQGIDKAVIENAARRGTRVHEACEAIASNLGEWDVDTEIFGYVESFKKWWGSGQKIRAIEKRFFCDELLITGQVDFILPNESGDTIFDLKTPVKASKTWPLQGAAYAYMARKSGFPINKIQFLQLSKVGADPVLHTYDPDEYIPLFLKTVDVFNYFFRRKKNGTADCIEV